MIYLDTSALVKLVFEEAESAALAGWLNERIEMPVMSSEVAAIELIRTCRRYDDEAVSGARQLLAGLDLLALTSDIVERAAVVGPVELRSLDAVHLASAMAVSGMLTAFVVYDARLRVAGQAAGLVAVAPA